MAQFTVYKMESDPQDDSIIHVYTKETPNKRTFSLVKNKEGFSFLDVVFINLSEVTLENAEFDEFTLYISEQRTPSFVKNKVSDQQNT